MAIRVHAFTDDALGADDATGVAHRIATGAVSATEAVEAAIERVERIDPQLRSVQFPDFDRARRAAGAGRTGAFAGVPTFIKDNVDYAGLPTDQGSQAVHAHPAAAHGLFVHQFLDQGPVVLGKSRLPEFGFNATTEYETEPPARNPWNTDYSTGASSGGSAALVASGAVPIAHANDGAGSIRIPAACCGLVGLKPTRGRLLDEPGNQMLPVRIISEGVLTRSVRDTARFLASAERYYRNRRLRPIGQVGASSGRRLRVGLVLDSVTGHHTADETRRAVLATARLLEELGHHVEEIPMPVGRQFINDFTLYWGFLSFMVVRFGGRKMSPDFDPAQVDNLSKGLAAAYRARIGRTPQTLLRLRRTAYQYARVFRTHDVALSPVLAHATPRLGYLSPAQDYDQLMQRLIDYVSFTPLNNTAGGPGMSLPLGTSADGLPIASHFSAAHGDERTLLELAYELEEATPWPRIDQPGVYQT